MRGNFKSRERRENNRGGKGKRKAVGLGPFPFRGRGGRLRTDHPVRTSTGFSSLADLIVRPQAFPYLLPHHFPRHSIALQHRCEYVQAFIPAFRGSPMVRISMILMPLPGFPAVTPSPSNLDKNDPYLRSRSNMSISEQTGRPRGASRPPRRPVKGSACAPSIR